MATIQATEIRTEGSTIYIKSDPTIGILALTSFADNVSGETPPNITFTKLFRYTLNGVTYSDWQPLTTNAITSIQISDTDILIIELSYKKNPFDSTALTVSSATIGANTSSFVEGKYFTNSIFHDFFNSNDVDVLKWYVSVLEKLYSKGLIPSYINRLNEFDKPDDFIDFWKSIAHFFAYVVIYARKFEKFYENQFLLSEYLEQKGLKTSIYNNLNDLNYLMENFNKQIFNRGAISIIDKVENGEDIDGELLRLIYYNQISDEFLFNLYKKEHFGWNLGNASPLHRGLYLNDNVNKSYETSTEVSDLTLYPTTGTITKITDSGHSVMHIQDAGGISSLGNLKYIKVDPRMDYEISFMIKKSSDALLTFGVTAYDVDNTSIDLISAVDGTSSNIFLDGVTLVRDDKYILVKAFIYNKERKYKSSQITSLNQGNNLIFNPDTVKIIPTITIDSGSANIYAIRILPMQTEYSRGFLQTSNFISTWLINNNQKLNIKQVKNYIVRYLIPYNSHIKITSIGEFLYNPNDENINNYWVPGGEYCETTIWIPDAPGCLIKNRWVPDEDTAYCE